LRLSVNFRLESVIGGNPRDVRVVARSEALLLKTYGATKLNIFEVFLRKYITHSKMCVYTKTWASNEN
jgi:hypothetical protein